MRKSIGFKVFGIAVCSLLLMGAAAIWSIYSTAQVNRQLTTLAEALIPLMSSVDAMDEEIVLSQLALERVLALKPGSDRALLEASEKEFLRAAERVNQLLESSATYAKKGLQIAVLEAVKLKAARVEPMLEQLKHEHGLYCDHAAQVFKTLKGEVGTLPDATLGTVQRNVDEIRTVADKLSGEIRAFVIADASVVEKNELRALRANLVMIAAAAAVGILLAFLVSRGLVLPLLRLRTSAQAVEAGKLEGEVPVTSSDEVGDLTRAFNSMVVELKAKEKIKETFGQYVDPRVVSNLIDGRAVQASVGEKQLVTVFFSDIAGFTQIGERLTPQSLVNLINEYLTVMSEPIRARTGVIDKYIGDSIMAFWAPPFVQPSEQAVHACSSALEQFTRLKDFRKRIPDLIGLRQGIPSVDMRIGLASGEAVVGSIGSSYARSFTVMGDTVNLGSRLEGTNKVYGTHILMDAMTRDMAGDAIETRQIDSIAVVGKTEPVRIYELLSLRGQIDDKQRQLRELYEASLEHYRSGFWDKASEGFSGCLKLVPDDKPSLVMMDRTAKLSRENPSNWDGVWRLTSK